MDTKRRNQLIGVAVAVVVVIIAIWLWSGTNDEVVVDPATTTTPGAPVVE